MLDSIRDKEVLGNDNGIEKSDNTKGNPYHSKKDGRFVSKGEEGQAGLDIIEKRSLPNISSWLGKNDDDDDEEWAEIFGNGSASADKSVLDMSDEELDIENAELENYFNAKNINTSKIFDYDKKLRCANLHALKSLLEDYPNLDISKISIQNVSDITVSYAAEFVSPYPSIDINHIRRTVTIKELPTRINLNTDKASSTEKLIMNHKVNAMIGHWRKCTNEEYLSNDLLHELGHFIEYKIILQKLYNKYNGELPYNVEALEKFKKEQSSIKRSNEIQKDIYTNYYLKLASAENISPLSFKEFMQATTGYGKTNSEEWFAEQFAGSRQKDSTIEERAVAEYIKNNL